MLMGLKLVRITGPMSSSPNQLEGREAEYELTPTDSMSVPITPVRTSHQLV
jgi:hypothetical protein